MRYFFGAVFALAASVSPIHAAEHPALSASKALCMANHADPDKVVLAAKAEGWQPPSASTTVYPGEILLVRSVGASSWMLSLRTQDNSKFGLTASRMCNISVGPSEGDIVGSVREFVGFEPASTGEGGVAIWYFVMKSGRRESLPDTRAITFAEALNKGPVISIFAGGGGSITQVQYSEYTPWPKSTPSESRRARKKAN
jgi:hypothetical protein